MFFKQRTRLTQEGWCFVVVLALVTVRASMKDINLMLAFAGMMVGVLYFNWFALRMMYRRLTIRRRMPESISAGDTVTIELEADCPHRATAVEIEDSFQLAGSTRREDQARGVAIFPQVVRGQTARAEYRVRFGRRGKYEFGLIRATSRYPFRLIARTVGYRRPQELIVLPRLGRLTNRWTMVRRGPEPGPHRVLQRQGLTEGDFYGMRDWRPGDSRRWIHWRTSARRGSLMVRQFEQPRSENLTLLVDLWRPDEPEPRHEDNVELAVSFAATVAADVCRRGGCQLRVVIGGEQIASLGGGASRSLAGDVMRQLAVADATPYDRLPQLIERGLNEGFGGRIVLVTTRSQNRDHAADEVSQFNQPPQNRAALARMMRIDASSDQLFEYYHVD